MKIVLDGSKYTLNAAAYPFKQALKTSPLNPEGALTPSMVPFVLQPLLVVPAGSIRNKGLVEVAVPPLKTDPARVTEGVEAAPEVENTLAEASRA